MGAKGRSDTVGIELGSASKVPRLQRYLDGTVGSWDGYVELTRPVNVAFACLLTLIGAFVAGGALATTSVCAALVATVGVMSGGNAINDYFDRRVDEINNPERPIPRGAVSERGALAFGLGMFVVAVVAAIPLSTIGVAIVVANTVGGLTYTQVFKPLPGVGNALIAYIVPSHFLLGGAAVGAPSNVVVLFGLAALATLAREIVKDVEDVVGDRQEGLRTLPIVLGERSSVLLGVGVVSLAVAASVVPYLRETLGVEYLVAVVPANLVLLGATTYAVADPTTSQRWLKVGMFLAAVAFVLGRASAIL